MERRRNTTNPFKLKTEFSIKSDDLAENSCEEMNSSVEG